MIHLADLTAYLDDLLAARDYDDYAPNGLQVEGRPEVATLITGVTASLALIEQAVERGADALLVHHGWFWRGEAATVTGMKRRRLKALLSHDISLIAYHLPLDGHPSLGNNARLGQRLGFIEQGRFGSGPNGGIACHGRLPTPADLDQLAEQIAATLGRIPTVVSGGPHPISRIGWCSGAAQGAIEQAACLGLDAYLSGEISEPTAHIAREQGIHYLACGHHATERYGALALGNHLAERFGLETTFIDLANPA